MKQSSSISRRELLAIGASTPLLEISSSLLHAQETTRNKLLPVIIFWNEGGPSSKELWNPDEPSVPKELGGEFNSIETQIPGCNFCELWPELAKRNHLFSLLRSLDSETTAHAHATQQALQPDEGETFGLHWGAKSAYGGFPYSFIRVPGTYANDTDAAHQDDLAMDISWNGEDEDEETYDEDGVVHFRDDLPPWEKRKGRYMPPKVMTGGKELSRLLRRKSLLEELDISGLEGPVVQRMTTNREVAFSLLTGEGKFLDAFRPPSNEQKEYERDLRRYGDNMVGRSVLLARRLVERGAGVVTIHNGPYKGWDQHYDLFKDIPPMAETTDKAAAALIDDIAENRVQCVLLLMGEFNRTPKVNDRGGRDHWTEGTCAILAGGGIVAGKVIGKTKPDGSTWEQRIPTKHNISNTLIHAAGGEDLLVFNQPRVRDILLP